MAKKKKSESEKSSKSPTKFFLVSSFVLFVILAISIYHNSANPTAGALKDFVSHKQELHDLLGPVKKISGIPNTQVLDKTKQHNLSVNLVGKDKEGTLSLVVAHKNNEWKIVKASLKIGNSFHRLSPMYVKHVSFYDNETQTNEKKTPVFKAGKDVYIKTILYNIPSKATHLNISQNLAIFDSNNKLLAKKNNVANYDSNAKVANNELGFTTHIANLPPGTYYVNLSFKENISHLTENHWRKVIIGNPAQNISVRSLSFYKEKNHTNKKTEKTFTTDEDIFVQIYVDGFMAKNNKIEGLVDLKIENLQGKLIAYKPRFATIKQNHQPSKQIAIDGHLKLTEPDIYLLSFRIQDDQAHTQVVHSEKIVVQFPDFSEPTNTTVPQKETS